MKLPKIKKKDKRSELEKERDAYVSNMWAHRDDPDVYGQMCENAAVMTEAIADEKDDVKVLDVLAVVFPLAGTLAVCASNIKVTNKVTRFEETDVITSKVAQFKLPWRS